MKRKWVACGFVGLAAVGCERGAGRVVAPPAQVAPSAQVVAPLKPAHQPRPRAWRLHPQTPFKLVGEGLRDIADLSAINGATVLVGEPCSAPPGRETAPPNEVHVVVGDSFSAQALPALSTPAGKLTNATIEASSSPSDLWLSLGYVSTESSYVGGALLAHWNGKAWELFGGQGHLGGLDPSGVLPWHDGAKLLSQYLPRPHRGSSIEPFRVFGKTTRPPPDFSKLPFPPPKGDLPVTSVDYAALSTHELFAAYWSAGNRSFGIGRTTGAGNPLLDVVDASPGAPGPVNFAVGNLNGQERAIAWSVVTRNNGRDHSLWLRSYDRQAFTQLPVPPSFSEDGYAHVWLAGGSLWARQVTNVWRGDGATWSKHATVSSGAQLTPTADGSLWVKERDSIHRIDPQGQRQEIPFLAASAQKPSLTAWARIFAGAAPDDVWLETHEDDEVLLFRTRAMTNMLWCD